MRGRQDSWFQTHFTAKAKLRPDLAFVLSRVWSLGARHNLMIEAGDSRLPIILLSCLQREDFKEKPPTLSSPVVQERESQG